MAERDVLATEVGAALAILGLLLVFLPLLTQSFQTGTGGRVDQAELRARGRRPWWAVATMAIAGLDATLGLIGFWNGQEELAKATGFLLIALVWAVVGLAGMSVGWLKR